MKKAFCLLIALALMLGIVNVGALAEEPVTVTLAVWGSGASENFNKGAAAFNARQDKINFVVEMAGDWDTYIGAKIASNDLPDMYFLNPYSDVQQYAANGRLLDLSDQAFAGKIYDTIKDSCLYDGKTYAYPMCMEFLGIFYNVDLFNQAGIAEVPQTLDELRAACEKLQAAGITPFAATYLDDWTLNHAFSTLLGAVTPDWNAMIDNLANGGSFGDVERIGEVFDFFDLMKEYSGSKYMDANSTAGFNALGSGEAAMLFSGEFSLLNLGSINPDLNVGLMGVPVSNDPAETKVATDVGICVGINPNGAHVAEALEVLNYMSDNADSEGWMNASADSLGAAPPAMDYTMKTSYQYYTDYTTLMGAGKVQNWLFLRWASGFASGPDIQKYFAGTADRDQTIAALDQTYQGNLE
ncbi:MAG: extracellular solute-binding protein [Eubacteriales bacterium]|nr:extracellular solute-binding protein [Eubacteriales bacterium]